MLEKHAEFIHEFVPAQTGSPYTLLLLHGTGGDERDLLSLGLDMGGGVALLSPRGKSLENGMPRFFRRKALGVFDIEDLKVRTQELADFVAASAERYGFDPTKLIALGYSNGANIAASLLLLRPETLAGALLLRPMVPLIPSQLPDLTNLPVWIGGGKQDPIITPDQTAELVSLLQQAGASVEVHWSPGGHQLNAAELQDAKRWLTQQFASRETFAPRHFQPAQEPAGSR